MFGSYRLRCLLPLAALALAAALGGCVAYPAYGGYYGNGYYYGRPAYAYSGDWRWHRWHDYDWR